MQTQTPRRRLRLVMMTGTVALAAAACTLFPVDVAVTAAAVDGTNASALGVQSINLGSGVVVTSYEVTFYRIEVGNNDDDKFTLWEDEAGVTQDLVAAVAFENVLPATWGTYQFMRVTIGEDLDLAGTVLGVSGSATATVTGQTTDAAMAMLPPTMVKNAAVALKRCQNTPSIKAPTRGGVTAAVKAPWAE